MCDWPASKRAGHLGSIRTVVIDIDDTVFQEFKISVNSTRFLSMGFSTGVWRIDADRCFFESCSAGKYHAVEREKEDADLGDVFALLGSLPLS